MTMATNIILPLMLIEPIDIIFGFNSSNTNLIDYYTKTFTSRLSIMANISNILINTKKQYGCNNIYFRLDALGSYNVYEKLGNINSKYESKTYKQPLCNAIYSLVSDLRHGTDITVIIITAISQELRYTVCETTIEYKIYKVYSHDK
jgi:hypothetical protein